MHSATAGLYNSPNDSICDGGCAQDGVGSSFVPNKSTNDAIGGGGGWRYGMVAPPNTVPMMTPMMAMIAFMLVEVVRKVVAAIWDRSPNYRQKTALQTASTMVRMIVIMMATTMVWMMMKSETMTSCNNGQNNEQQQQRQ